MKSSPTYSTHRARLFALLAAMLAAAAALSLALGPVGVPLGEVLRALFSGDDASAAAWLDAQDPEDLTWIREEFWGAPAGLAGERGDGPVIVAGHTPTPYLERMAHDLDRDPIGEDGLARMVRVGGDRWDIDCCAAGGAGLGQVLVLRLDDGAEFYEPVREGE